MLREKVEERAIIERDASSGVKETGPGANAFQRLHALVRKGYKAEIGVKEDTSIILLRHLGKAPDLVLRTDGTIEPWQGRRPWHKRKLPSLAAIPVGSESDQLKFMTFLDAVPRASLRDRTRPWRNKYLYFPMVLVVVWGLYLGMTTMFLGL